MRTILGLHERPSISALKAIYPMIKPYKLVIDGLPVAWLDPCQVLTIVYQCRELHQYFTFAPTEPGHSWINYCDTKDFPPATHLKVPFKADGRLCWWELGMVIEDGWHNSLELVELYEIHHKEHGENKIQKLLWHLLQS